VIEDEAETRANMKELLQRSDYRVLIAEDENTAIEQTERQRPDLVVVDLAMPPSDVLAVGRRIRRRAELGEHVPVVVIASTFEDDLEGQDIKVGAHEYISYMTDFEELENLISQLLH
jgi:CheY-like chemotaxis protein